MKEKNKMYSLIKFYLKLPDTNLNAKMVPIVVYSFTRMQNTSLSCTTHAKAIRTRAPLRWNLSSSGISGKKRGDEGRQSLYRGLLLFTLVQWRQEREPPL